VSLTLYARNRKGERAELRVSSWDWGALHSFVEQAQIFPEQVWEKMRVESNNTLEAPDVLKLAEFLERVLLKRLKPGQRLLLDGTVTDVPDDGTFYREESELWKDYGLKYESLLEIVTFL
jgi:hypothetical protein